MKNKQTNKIKNKVKVTTNKNVIKDYKNNNKKTFNQKQNVINK